MIEFDEQSEMISIEEGAFAQTKIENINIPASVKELHEGWNNSANIVSVTVSQNNQFFKNLDNKLLVGKSNPKSDNFDVIFFCSLPN